jgi:hypothetical protein
VIAGLKIASLLPTALIARSISSCRAPFKNPLKIGRVGLVLNILVLWNTRYMEAALIRLRADSWRTSTSA